MFNNIGGKIKSLATAAFIIDTIAAIITGISLMAIDEDMVLAGLLVIVGGFFVAWVSVWLLYAFGQLVENSDIIVAELTRKQHQPQQSVAPSHSVPSAPPVPKPATVKKEATAPTPKLHCQNCHTPISYYPCPQCGFPSKDIPYWCGNCGQLGPYDGPCPQCGSTMKAYNTTD